MHCKITEAATQADAPCFGFGQAVVFAFVFYRSEVRGLHAKLIAVLVDQLEFCSQAALAHVTWARWGAQLVSAA